MADPRRIQDLSQATSVLQTDKMLMVPFGAGGNTPGPAQLITMQALVLILLNSTALTGVPTAPTAVVDTNTTQVATCAYVLGQLSSANPGMDGTAAPGTSTRFARADHVHPTDTSRYAATNPSGFQTAAQVTTALAPYAPLASPTLTGTPAAPTAAVNTNTTQLATTAFVLAQAGAAAPVIDGAATVGVATKFAREDHVHPTDTSRAPTSNPTFTNTVTIPNINGGQIAGFRNGIINGGFLFNQRTYVSGTATAAGVYMHDRWKAGAGGCTYTFAQSGGPQTTITITAGTLQQVIEGVSVGGGNYVLSWTGTAQAKINGSALTASPKTVAGLSGGSNVTIEFGTGSVGSVMFELNSQATPFELRPAGAEFALCQRYYQAGTMALLGFSQASGIVLGYQMPLPVAMRAVPTVTMTWTTQTNCAGGAAGNVSAASFEVFVTTNTAAASQINGQGTFTATAEL